MEALNRIGGRRIRAVLGELLRTPLPWAMGAGAWLIGTAFGEVALALGVALAVQGGLVALALRDEKFTESALRAQGETEARRILQRLQEDTAGLDVTTRERLEKILRMHVAIRRECVAPDVPRYARAPLAATLQQIERLTIQASELAVRRSELSQFLFLGGVNRSELHGQHASLKARYERIYDPVLKAQLEQSLHFKSQEIESYDNLHLAIARVDGQLESLECAFAALKARIFQFKSDEKTEWSEAGALLRDEMNTLSAQVDTLNESVREALTLRGGA